MKWERREETCSSFFQSAHVPHLGARSFHCALAEGEENTERAAVKYVQKPRGAVGALLGSGGAASSMTQGQASAGAEGWSD